MENLEIKKENALAAYHQASKKGKKLLACLLGATVFEEDVTAAPPFNADITERVKTFEDACKVLGKDAADESWDDYAITDDDKAVNSFIKLRIITAALNEGWTPNWSNYNEPKYYAEFNMATGDVFKVYLTPHFSKGTCAKLCFRTHELAEYAGKQFIGLYKDFYTL